MKYENSNGLSDGNIPPGGPCPFLSQCGLRVDSCPTTEKPKLGPYSCAAARAHSMIIESELNKAKRSKE